MSQASGVEEWWREEDQKGGRGGLHMFLAAARSSESEWHRVRRSGERDFRGRDVTSPSL